MHEALGRGRNDVAEMFASQPRELLIALGRYLPTIYSSIMAAKAIDNFNKDLETAKNCFAAGDYGKALDAFRHAAFDFQLCGGDNRQLIAEKMARVGRQLEPFLRKAAAEDPKTCMESIRTLEQINVASGRERSFGLKETYQTALKVLFPSDPAAQKIG